MKKIKGLTLVEWVLTLAPIINKNLEKILLKIVNPTLKALKKGETLQWFLICGSND